MQIPARTPAMTAMTAATLDTLSGGRFRLGLGVSGPQVSEGWHGVRFDKPLGRTREYVDIVTTALRREPVAYEGEHFTLPLPDGPGKALRLDRAPGARPHADLPRRGRAEEPRADRGDRRRLAGDLLQPRALRRAARPDAHGPRRAGRAPTTTRSTASTSCPPCRWSSATTSRRAPTRSAATPRSTSAAWASREKNFYNQLAVRMGFEEAAQQVQDLYLDRRTTTTPRPPAVRVHRPHRAARPGRADQRTGCSGMPTAGVTTLTVATRAAPGEERLATVRTMAELMS